MQSITSTDEFEILLGDLRLPSDQSHYSRCLTGVNSTNVFHTLELILHAQPASVSIHAFILEKDSKPLIVLPFNKTKIVVGGAETAFYDVSSPYGYSGPQFDPENVSRELLTSFWKRIDTWYLENNVITEFIRFSLNDNHIGYTGNTMPTSDCVIGKVLDKESQWSNFKSKVRNNVRKAQNLGCQSVILHKNISKEDIDTFHEIYIKTMERKHATSTYYFPISMFYSLIEKHPNECVLALVYQNDIAISTELCLIEGDSLYSFLGGTLEEYFTARPNDYLKNSVINWARDNNVTQYSLGGGKNNNDSLYKYKKSFFPNDIDAMFLVGNKIVNPELYANLNDTAAAIRSKKTSNELFDYFPPYRIQ